MATVLNSDPSRSMSVLDLGWLSQVSIVVEGIGMPELEFIEKIVSNLFPANVKKHIFMSFIKS